MRILFITEKFPYPLDTGGNVRTFHMLRALSSEHEVTLLSNYPEKPQEQNIDALRNICTNVELIRATPGSRTRSIGRVISCLFTRKSILLERHVTRGAELAVRRLMSDGSSGQRNAKISMTKKGFDAVHFNHLDTALYENYVPRGVLRVLDQHNVVTNQVRTTLSVESRVLHRWALRRESRVLPAVEQRLCNKMDLCLTCSDSDSEWLRSIGVKSRVETVPNGVDLEFFSMNSERTRNLDVVFVGSLDYDPCDKAVQYFCTDILPRLHHKYPELRFIAVGKSPSVKLGRLAERDHRIVITGRVDDVRPYVQAAAVCVVPLLSGSGTRLKILEALALGTPVVTTRIGVEGIDATHEVDLLVADTAPEFTEAVSRILQNAALADRLRQEGRTLVEQRYGWDSCQVTLLSHYRSAEGRG